MTSNLEIPASYAGGASLRADYQTASVRHSGWMLELERALLELNAAKRPSEAEYGGANERRDVGCGRSPDDARNASLSPDAETGRTPALSSSVPHDAGNVPLGQERIAVFMVIPVDEEPIDNPGGLRQPRVEIDKLRHAPDGHRAGEGADRMSPIRPAFAGLFRRLI